MMLCAWSAFDFSLHTKCSFFCYPFVMLPLPTPEIFILSKIAFLLYNAEPFPSTEWNVTLLLLLLLPLLFCSLKYFQNPLVISSQRHTEFNRAGELRGLDTNESFTVMKKHRNEQKKKEKPKPLTFSFFMDHGRHHIL